MAVVLRAYRCDNLDYKYFIEIKEVMDFVIGNTDHGKSGQYWNLFKRWGSDKISSLDNSIKWIQYGLL